MRKKEFVSKNCYIFIMKNDIVSLKIRVSNVYLHYFYMISCLQWLSFTTIILHIVMKVITDSHSISALLFPQMLS